MPLDSAALGGVLAHGAASAQSAAAARGAAANALPGAPAAGQAPGPTDVVVAAWKGAGQQGAVGLLDMADPAMSAGDRGRVDATALGDVPGAIAMAAGDVGTAFGEISKAQGALATTGAVFGALTAVEQLVSVPLSAIPFPAFPAVRVFDTDVGLPHAHGHPPNLIPPAPPVPLPSAGPVIPIPYASGASTVLINGMPAARCGDMGLGIWCGGYFPMFEIFLGSSSVWIEGARAARLGVDITKHCIFTTPRPSDPPLGPMVGMLVQASPNVVIGGVPMPSLSSMAIGAAFKVALKGVGKVVGAARRAAKGAKAAGRAADDVVPMFSKGDVVPTRSRPQALADVLDEIKAKNVELRMDDEAQAYLDYCARMNGADPKSFHAVTLGDDLIFVRPEHADNPRILREELIHTDQAKAGKVSSDRVVANEIEAREQMIERADEWGMTPDEVAEMRREIEHMRKTGTY